MKKIRFWAILFIISCTVGCKQKTVSEWIDCCPYATIYLQPYDNYSQKEVEKLKADLDKHLEGILYGSFEVKVLPNKPLSDSFLGETGKKYRVDKIIKDMKSKADEHNILNHGVGESDHFFNLTNPKYMISGLYTKKISIKVDFLSNIFGRINFYVYFLRQN